MNGPALVAFDPDALRRYLEATWPPQTIYIPIAFAARPDLFGGGTLTGSQLDKLLLPTGRVYDLLVGASIGGIRWWVADVTDQAPGAGDDAFPLEPGPLRFLEGPLFVRDRGGLTFEGLVARALEPTRGDADVVDQARQTIASTLAEGSELEASAGELAAADEEIDAQLATQHDVDLSDVIAATDRLPE